jgi:type I restriction enzyme S subunit
MRFSSSNFDEPIILPASSLCESIFDGTHDSPKQQEFGFKLVTSRHIKANKILLEEAYFISEEDYLKINKRSRLQIGDVLFTMIGTVGEVCRVATEPDFAIKNIGVFRPAESSDSAWIYYYLLSPEGRKSIDAAKRGTTQQFMGLKELREFPFIFPKDSRYRQKQMQILEQIDAKIEANRKISRTLEEIAQTIFKSWFIDFDPVKAKMAGKKPAGMDAATAALFPDSMEESELGLIPSGWELKKVEEMLTRITVKGLPKSTVLLNLGRTLVLEQGDSVIAGFIDEDADVKATNYSPAFVFGDHTCRMRLSTMPFSIFPNTIVLTSELINTYWAFGATWGIQKFETYRRHWMELAYKVLVVPNTEVANVYGEQVKPFFELIDSLMVQNRVLSALRDDLLPRLISGELKIPEDMLAS